MNICISVGHSILKSGSCTSANGLINEYLYCKSLAPVLQDTLSKEGNKVDVIICPERQFKSKNEEKTYKLEKINRSSYDLVVELHLNSYNGSAKGTEILYYSSIGKEYALRIVNKLGDIFSNRGAKERKDLYMLKSTKYPSIIVEIFFCDNISDLDIAKQTGLKSLSKLIAEGILNRKIQ